jgi:Mrp family chromosome partitioning ATPase/capsular polysaccharide biosynthesis protein
MKDASIESAGREPTVVGSVRRYSVMVIAFALAGLIAAIGYAHFTGRTYRAQASITAAVPQTQQTPDPAQYLDSQVVLMESPAVAQKAAALADATLHNDSLSASDFSVTSNSLSITPPTAGANGAFGSSIVQVAFTASTAETAQVGANSFIQAFTDERSAQLAAQFQAAIGGVDNTIEQTTNATQRAALEDQRTQLLVNEQIDLAQAPTAALALKPTSPASGSWKRIGLIGLVIGLVIGVALAYARALRRRGFIDRQDPATLYGVPLIGEIPAFDGERPLRSNGKVARGLPVIADPDSAVTEAFRFAAGSLERVRAEKGRQLSVVFVSPLSGTGKSMVVANLALAIADGGTRVLAVDAGDGDLTARLLPGIPAAGGLEEVLSGERQLADCIQLSPFNDGVSVLRAGPSPQHRVAGAARSAAASALLATAKSSFDIVLIDSPALLQVAGATQLVDSSDAAIIVLSPSELIRDHLEMVSRLGLIGANIIGYIYNRVPVQPRLVRYQRNGSPAPAQDTLAMALSADSVNRVNGGGSRPAASGRG